MVQVSRVLLAQLVLLMPTCLMANHYFKEHLVETLPVVVMRTSACQTMKAANNAATTCTAAGTAFASKEAF